MDTIFLGNDDQKNLVGSKLTNRSVFSVEYPVEHACKMSEKVIQPFVKYSLKCKNNKKNRNKNRFRTYAKAIRNLRLLIKRTGRESTSL